MSNSMDNPNNTMAEATGQEEASQLANESMKDNFNENIENPQDSEDAALDSDKVKEDVVGEMDDASGVVVSQEGAINQVLEEDNKLKEERGKKTGGEGVGLPAEDHRHDPQEQPVLEVEDDKQKEQKGKAGESNNIETVGLPIPDQDTSHTLARRILGVSPPPSQMSRSLFIPSAPGAHSVNNPDHRPPQDVFESVVDSESFCPVDDGHTTDPPSIIAHLVEEEPDQPVAAVAEKLTRGSVYICGKHIQIRTWHWCLLLALVVVIVVCVAVPLSLKDSSKEEPSKENQTQSDGQPQSEEQPSEPEELLSLQRDWNEETIRFMVVPSVSDNETLLDPHSPQSRALNWMVASNGTAVLSEEDPMDIPWRVRQRYILAVLYYSTEGHNWKKQFGYLNEDAHECDWAGDNNGWRATDCNEDLEVNLINLWSNRLGGTLPKEITSLPKLTTVDFLTNRIGGTIPNEFGLVTDLTYLNLGINNFVGTIPTVIGALDQLTYFMVDSNDLTGTIPSELGSLVHLDGWLHLGGNRLTGTVPETFAMLTNATWIYFNDLNLTGSVEFLCEALEPGDGENSTSNLLELWADRDQVTCSCCTCCP